MLVGCELGEAEGFDEGSDEGEVVGSAEGEDVGNDDGILLGSAVGYVDG